MHIEQTPPCVIGRGGPRRDEDRRNLHGNVAKKRAKVVHLTEQFVDRWTLIVEQLLEGGNHLLGLRPDNNNVRIPIPSARASVYQRRNGLAEGRDTRPHRDAS